MNKSDYLADGFAYDGQPPVEIVNWDQQWEGVNPDFYDLHIVNVDWAGVAPTPAPEPSALLLLAVGLGGLAFYGRRNSAV